MVSSLLVALLISGSAAFNLTEDKDIIIHTSGVNSMTGEPFTYGIKYITPEPKGVREHHRRLEDARLGRNAHEQSPPRRRAPTQRHRKNSDGSEYGSDETSKLSPSDTAGAVADERVRRSTIEHRRRRTSYGSKSSKLTPSDTAGVVVAEQVKQLKLQDLQGASAIGAFIGAQGSPPLISAGDSAEIARGQSAMSGGMGQIVQELEGCSGGILDLMHDGSGIGIEGQLTKCGNKMTAAFSAGIPGASASLKASLDVSDDSIGVSGDISFPKFPKFPVSEASFQANLATKKRNRKILVDGKFEVLGIPAPPPLPSFVCANLWGSLEGSTKLDDNGARNTELAIKAGVWLDAELLDGFVTATCRSGYKVKRSADNPQQGDICCRESDTRKCNRWEPPHGCVKISNAPFSVVAGTKAPCRTGVAVSGGVGFKASSRAFSSRVHGEASTQLGGALAYATVNGFVVATRSLFCADAQAEVNAVFSAEGFMVLGCQIFRQIASSLTSNGLADNIFGECDFFTGELYSRRARSTPASAEVTAAIHTHYSAERSPAFQAFASARASMEFSFFDFVELACLAVEFFSPSLDCPISSSSNALPTFSFDVAVFAEVKDTEVSLYAAAEDVTVEFSPELRIDFREAYGVYPVYNVGLPPFHLCIPWVPKPWVGPFGWRKQNNAWYPNCILDCCPLSGGTALGTCPKYGGDIACLHLKEKETIFRVTMSTVWRLTVDPRTSKLAFGGRFTIKVRLLGWLRELVAQFLPALGDVLEFDGCFHVDMDQKDLSFKASLAIPGMPKRWREWFPGIQLVPGMQDDRVDFHFREVCIVYSVTAGITLCPKPTGGKTTCEGMNSDAAQNPPTCSEVFPQYIKKGEDGKAYFEHEAYEQARDLISEAPTRVGGGSACASATSALLVTGAVATMANSH